MYVLSYNIIFDDDLQNIFTPCFMHFLRINDYGCIYQPILIL